MTAPTTSSPPKKKLDLKDHYRPAPETSRRITAGITAVVLFILGADILGVPLAFLAAVTFGYCIAEQTPTKLARTLALALAVWSHGPVSGVESDRCFPARAKHFLGYIRTGENRRVVPKLPELGRWCTHCGAAEWCVAPDGSVHAHDYQPADTEPVA